MGFAEDRAGMMSEPAENKHMVEMSMVAEYLQQMFPDHGFALLVFDMNTTEGEMGWISNADRKDMLVALKEFIAHNEGRAMPPARA